MDINQKCKKCGQIYMVTKFHFCKGVIMDKIDKSLHITDWNVYDKINELIEWSNKVEDVLEEITKYIKLRGKYNG